MISQFFQSLWRRKFCRFILLGGALLVVLVIGTQMIESLRFLPYLLSSLLTLSVVYAMAVVMVRKYSSAPKRILLYTAITGVIGLICYSVVVYGREFTYTIDHVCYFNLQSELYQLYYRSPIKGIAGSVTSMWFSDYSYFINILLAFPFYFTSHSNEAYVVVFYVFLIVPTCLAMNLLVENLSEQWKIHRKREFFLLCNFLWLTFPLLHFASLLGMPDIFGLYFIFLILTLLLNFDFTNKERFDYRMAALAACLCVCAVVTRRWYMFTIMGLLPAFCGGELAERIGRRKTDELRIVLKNEGKLGAAIVIIFGTVMAPFVYKTLFIRNYVEEYAEYNAGGGTYELWNQAGFLGVLFCGVIACGVLYGLKTGVNRKAIITAVLGFAITLFGFTRIQNMGKHQSLCLMVYYLIAIWSALSAIIKVRGKAWKALLIAAFMAIALWNDYATLTGSEHLEGIHLTTKYIVKSWFEWK